MSAVSQAAEIAQVKVDLLETIQEAREVAYSLKKRDDEIAELQHEMRTMAQRAQEDKETALSLERAEHAKEIALDKKADADVAESLVNRYVEKELKALGATAALASFRAKRAQRRQEVDKAFRCNDNVDDGAKLRRATKRRQNFEDEEARDEECKKQRIEQLDDKWAEDWNEVLEKNNEYEDSIVRYKEDIAREKENGRMRRAAIANHTLQQKSQVAEKQANRKIWAPYNKKLKTTEAHEEVDIPEFGDAQAEYEEDDEGRHYPLNWEVDRAEQFGIFIIAPPRIEPEVIDLD